MVHSRARSPINNAGRSSRRLAPLRNVAPLLLLLQHLPYASAQSGERSGSSWLRWVLVAVGAGLGAVAVAAAFLQIALWHPDSCLAQLLVRTGFPPVVTPILARRNQAHPVQGVPMVAQGASVGAASLAPGPNLTGVVVQGTPLSR